MAQNKKKMYENKATVKYSSPKNVFTNRPFFPISAENFHIYCPAIPPIIN